MISYIYGFIALSVCLGAIYLIGLKLGQWLPAIVVSSAFALTFTLFYYFYLEQMLVKRWGGTMSMELAPGLQHIAATWKNDHLWIENYDPVTNQCIFQEYSRGNVLEGKVIIKNCNPISRSAE